MTSPLWQKVKRNNKRSQPQWEAHALQLESSPRSPQLEKAWMQQWRPSAAKTNKYLKKQLYVNFLFLGSKITVDGDCSHEIKRYLLLGRKAMTNLDSILKSRDITLPTKVRTVKAMVFPVVMYGCERWTIKKDWNWSSNTLATWCQEPVYWKRPWSWERLKARREGVKEDEMVEWHHWLNGHEFEQAMGVGDGQGSLVCYSPWGHKESGNFFPFFPPSE